jgi:beta-glucosidase
MASHVWYLLGILLLGCCLNAAPSNTETDRRIEDYLRRMTIDEKLGQMSQSVSMTTLTDKIRQEIRAGRWGSFLNAGSPAERAEAQRIARKESRLGIPLLFGRDVIHGYRTIFPIPLGEAATWDPELLEQASRAAAREASAEAIRWTFAPMLDIARDPRWGRIAESPGEDPYLAGRLAAAYVRGFQGTKLSDPASLAACVKHFVAYGAAVAGRDYNSAWVPEIELREVYFPPFRAAIDAGVASLMTSFNTVNGVPATANDFLLHRILRGEWKFQGLVISDYEGVPEMVTHGYAADAADAAREAVNAGIDMEMVSSTYYDHLKAALDSHRVTMKTIDDAVRRVLRLKFQLGLFDEPIPAPQTVSPTPESLALAERVATESVVLLKNANEVLPLPESIGSVAVIGPLADSPVDQMGTWVMDGRSADVQTPLTALRQMLGDSRVHYAAALKNSRDTSHEGFAAALDAARQSDAVVLFLGEEEILSGEARSRAYLNLPGAQEALVDEVIQTRKPAIMVIMAGRPLTFHDVAAKVGAVLYAWHSGTMGGPAIANLLFGRAVPSGKLTVTFPRTVGQVPIYYAELNTGRPALPEELGIPAGTPARPTGYTSKYIDVDPTPEYPFGFGLSYTKFAYSDLRVSPESAAIAGEVTVSANIANSGSREATEIVQLYTHQVTASVVQPVRLLKNFRRVTLKPGEMQRVSFRLKSADLAFYNQDLKLVTEPGKFEVWIAPNAESGLRGEFSLH